MLEDEKIVELIWMLLGSAILGLIGFVWRISHRVADLEKVVDSVKEIHRRDIADIRRELDVIYTNVDKNREWTTNRMMSIAKDLKD
jgi:cystathionine beta-lyase family protein involved in aluminum resistance